MSINNDIPLVSGNMVWGIDSAVDKGNYSIISDATSGVYEVNTATDYAIINTDSTAAPKEFGDLWQKQTTPVPNKITGPYEQYDRSKADITVEEMIRLMEKQKNDIQEIRKVTEIVDVEDEKEVEEEPLKEYVTDKPRKVVF